MRFLMKLAGAGVLLLAALGAGLVCLALFGSGVDRLIDGIQLGSLERMIQAVINLAGFGIVLVVLAIFLVAIWRHFAGGQHKLRRDPEQLNETLMIQEIHAGLSRMEDRIEALETILFDRTAPSPSGHTRPKAGRSL